jgi:predicted DCC family thiol-disulfide oxidoreductase YuxK
MPWDTCYYDGQCGMCQRTRRVLAALDWLGRLDFRDLLKTPPADLPVPQSAALQGMPMKTRHGRVLLGFPAVRRALLQTPVGFLLAIFLYVPGISHAARVVYAHIAANRSRSCAVTSA